MRAGLFWQKKHFQYVVAIKVSWGWCFRMDRCLFSFLLHILFSWETFLLLIAICKGDGYVGVYECCNQGMSAVWVIVLSFLLLVLIVVSSLPCCDCWLLCYDLFIMCGRVSDSKVCMEWTGVEGWGGGHVSHSPVTTLLLLDFI